MPNNPNGEIPQRTEPAIQPEAPAPVDPVEVEEEVEVAENPQEILSGILSNPATVTAVIEFLKAENLDISDVEVKEGFWGWSEGSDLATIELGSKEYFVSPDNDTTHALAIAMVKNDLGDEPGLFNQSFIENYINKERLTQMLRSDVEEQVREQLRYEQPEVEVDEDNPDAVEADDADQAFEDRVEAETDKQLADPVQYLIDIYGQEEGVKQAMSIAGINIDEAAEDAVAADGEGHFLSTYDGNVNELPSGGEYWRHN